MGGVLVLSALGFLWFRFRSTGNKQRVPRARVNIPPDAEEGKEVISGNLDNRRPPSNFTSPEEMLAAARY